MPRPLLLRRPAPAPYAHILFLIFQSPPSGGGIENLLLPFSIADDLVMKLGQLMDSWRNGLVVSVLDCQSRDSEFKTTEWLHGQLSHSNDYQVLLGT